MIATNKAIDLQRRNKRHQLISLDGRGDSEENDGSRSTYLEGDELSDRQTFEVEWEMVRETLTNLPEHLRVVVHFVYFQGLKYREAAEAISIPVGTVKSRLQRRCSKLTECWNTHLTRTTGNDYRQREPIDFYATRLTWLSYWGVGRSRTRSHPTSDYSTIHFSKRS